MTFFISKHQTNVFFAKLETERANQQSKLDADADMKKAEISAAEELVDENEASVVGNLLPHLKNKKLEAELVRMYGADADKKIQQMAAGTIFKVNTCTALHLPSL